jgi:hypothetical protein
MNYKRFFASVFAWKLKPVHTQASVPQTVTQWNVPEVAARTRI